MVRAFGPSNTRSGVKGVEFSQAQRTRSATSGCTLQECSDIMKSNQRRSSSFACIQACIPDLFATNILLFLSNDGADSEWAHIRSALHSTLLDKGASWYSERQKKLRSLIANDWPGAQVSDAWSCNRPWVVVKSVFYMMFGVWLDHADAESIIGWRDHAVYFVLPRLVHRFLFNLLLRRVQRLRVRLIEKHGLESFIMDMNAKLPEKYRRRPGTFKLRFRFAVGFAGIGGTSACCETVGAFLQCDLPTWEVGFRQRPAVIAIGGEAAVHDGSKRELGYSEICGAFPRAYPRLAASSEQLWVLMVALQVCVVGGAGGIGQPLSMLMAMDPNVSELCVYVTASARESPPVAAQAVVGLIVNPVNSVVPAMCEMWKKKVKELGGLFAELSKHPVLTCVESDRTIVMGSYSRLVSWSEEDWREVLWPTAAGAGLVMLGGLVFCTCPVGAPAVLCAAGRGAQLLEMEGLPKPSTSCYVRNTRSEALCHTRNAAWLIQRALKEANV
eukprot:Skav222419  [mRNA]  locus=scaffold2890:78649:98092:+ [translate_table: standard]